MRLSTELIRGLSVGESIIITEGFGNIKGYPCQRFLSSIFSRLKPKRFTQKTIYLVDPTDLKTEKGYKVTRLD
jgi:hypothetical protein